MITLAKAKKDKCDCLQCKWAEKKQAEALKPVPYLICGMNYEEAEKYCEYVSQSCDGTTGYCAKDEVEGG